MFLTRVSVAQPVFAAMVMAAILVFGLAGWRAMPIDRFPPLDFPVTVVRIPWSGAAPEAVEAEISRPVEEALSGLAGLQTLTSTSSRGLSSVEASFSLETDGRQAAQDVRDRLASVLPDLPEGAGTPQVLRFDPLAAPVVSLALSSPSLDAAALTRLAREVVAPALTAVKGVGAANLLGAVDRRVEVRIDPDRLRAHGLGVADLIAALRSGNLLAPAGSVGSGAASLPLQVNAEARFPEALGALIVAGPGGAALRLSDLAEVVRAPADPRSLAFHDGRPALAVEILKAEGASVVAAARGVEAALARLAASGALGDARVDVLLNSAEEVEAIYKTLRATLIEGVVLAVAVVFLFLNSWRSTVITGLALPISFLGALAVMSRLGFSLNMLSMLALSLSVGVLVDDAIVVRENISRHLAMGKSRVRAALEGTQEIGLAVLAVTLALCAVFLPLAFMQGIVGRMFLQFGVTVAVAVLISMFVSFTLDPMLSSVWPDPDSEGRAPRGLLRRAAARFDRAFLRMAEGYRRLLGWSLIRRRTVMLLALASLAGSLLLVPRVGVEFLPRTDESRVSVTLETAVGSSMAYTALKAGQAAELLRTRPEVAGVYATVAADGEENAARIELLLTRPGARATSAEALASEVRLLLRRIPGAEFAVGTPGGVGPDEAPIAYFVTGRDPEALAETARRAAAAIAAIPGAAEVRTSLGDPLPLLELRILREAAADLGVTPQAAAEALRAMVEGAEVSEMAWPDGLVEPVALRLPEALRRDPAALADLPVASGAGRTIALGEIARREEGFGPARIERRGRERAIRVLASVEGRPLGEVSAAATAALAALNPPAGVTISQGGDADLMGDAAADMATAMGLAVVFIYFVLASQFASFLQPLAIMASLPLAFSGVVLGLLAAGSTINLYSMIGVVTLMGLAVKNAILLVDRANQLQREGLPLREALLEAGSSRFRPILMTTLAMIFGMAPLAAALHPGSEQSASMAQAVIGGLISSTLLTLIVTPVVLTWLAQASQWARRVFGPPAPHISN